MALKVLPNEVRSMLRASAQINNYKTVVEELVYNAYDAKSTSIAIRVHLQENRIQVVDNGQGIAKIDFDALGQRYMTSKFTDMSTLKATPMYYGYRGEFLVNIIEISHNVKIISRYKDTEETWAKTFYRGKTNQNIKKMSTRPSKGTTVEIRGFLYNLNIQKRGIDPINDVQNIKTFLEQFSIVHNDISLSLRDDAKNEIIFKIHKNRDTYQTLSTLFNIEKNTIQELQVEKNQYKVKAFIGLNKTDIGKHWIYINGKFIHNSSKLHKIVNKSLMKNLLIKDKKKTKSKNNHDENHLFKQSVPFYFLFISCPYIDYDISTTLKQSIVEFKNWELIKKLLEKLVKFYIGDVTLKKNNEVEHQGAIQKETHNNNDNMRSQIKTIINKILGSNSKKLDVSQLHKGVKGKLIKRKNRKRTQKLNRNTLFLKISDKSGNEYIHNKGTDVQSNNIDNREELNVTKADNNYIVNTNIDIPKTLPKQKVTTPIAVKSVNTNNKVKLKRNKKKKQKKTNKMSPVSAYKIVKNNKSESKIKKTRKLKCNNKHCIQTLTKLDSMPKKSRMVAQEVDDFSGHKVKYQRNELKETDARRTDRMNMFACNKYYNNYMRYNIDKNVMYKIAKNPFKTTYDLVQTILKTQRKNEIDNAYTDYDGYKSDFICDSVVKRRPFQSYSPICDALTGNTNIKHKVVQESEYNTSFQALDQLSYENNSRYSSAELEYRQINTSDYSLPEKTTRQQSLRCEDLLNDYRDIVTQCNPSSDATTASLLTYESHKYKQYLIDDSHYEHTNANRYVNKTHSVSFITKQSRDNFITAKDRYKSTYKHLKTRPNKQINIQTNNKEYFRQMVNESYTIEFTKSDEINYSIQVSNQYNFDYLHEKKQFMDEIQSPNYEPSLGFGNTYTIPTYSISSGSNLIPNQTKNIRSNEMFLANSMCHISIDKENGASTINNKDENDSNEEVNIVFVSKPKCSNSEIVLDEESDGIEPINLCETVFGTENEAIANEFTFSFYKNTSSNDSLYKNVPEINYNIQSTKNNTQMVTVQNNNDDVSHHFSNTLTTKHLNKIHDIETNLQREINLVDVNTSEKNIQIIPSLHVLRNDNIEPILHNTSNNFDFKERLRFLPKGMSQIFEKCGSKTVCDYNMDEDYYENNIYNDFANNVQIQTEVYEPLIQNIEEATKDLYKLKSNVHKDNTSLRFDETSLKEAKVLNQVDCKFIAAIMKEKYIEANSASEYLVLFDQHAVHERIRLEQNLSDYIKEDTWKSVALDNITLRITQDETLYLHNYKDKFMQLGLQWNIMNNEEVSISTIPEAILGKNPREVDKIMKAVKNLIIEEINVIKLQKGCISLYPKSIMDLVFSEACRYAIKFGNKLTKNECMDLLKDLSNCKTPFQCAHGRPVMAVLLNIKSDTRDYKVDMATLLRFKLNKMSHEIKQ